MTRSEFLHKIPRTIHDPLFGTGRLQSINEISGIRGAYYRFPDDVTEHWTYGDDWSEVYDKLVFTLSKAGHIKEDLQLHRNQSAEQ
jgi:hypothetical protein